MRHDFTASRLDIRASSASKAVSLWRYTNVYIIIVIIICMLTCACMTEAASTACAPEHSFSLFVAGAGSSSSGDTLLPLPGDLTLGHVNDKYWKSNRPLELYYMLDRSSLGL